MLVNIVETFLLSLKNYSCICFRGTLFELLWISLQNTPQPMRNLVYMQNNLKKAPNRRKKTCNIRNQS
jgi:hypothetical protein